MRMGEYTTRKNCRFCKSNNVSLIIDLGFTPLAGDFLKKEQVGKELYYPLRIYLCKDCYLVQVLDIIPPKVLFKDYRYMSSIGLKKHFEGYAEEITKKYLRKKDFVVEIGSNDGVLLLPLKEQGIQVLGVDPAENIAEVANKRGVPTIPAFFNQKIAREILQKNGSAKVIVANNVLAHIDDMDEILSGINILLNNDGVLIFEVHYLVNLLKDLQYDFFYQEHLCYYSLTTLKPYLEKFGLEIFDTYTVGTHSGSIRVFAKKKRNNNYTLSDSYKKLIEEEKNVRINDVDTYKVFMQRINSHKKMLLKAIRELKEDNKKIIGYGASGRANTLLNFCGIDVNSIDYVVDASPERYGRYMPQSHIPVVNPERIRQDKFDCLIILAWNYADMIIEKEKVFFKNSQIFIPLPLIREITI